MTTEASFFEYRTTNDTNENLVGQNHETLNRKHLKELSAREMPDKNEYPPSSRGHAQGICTNVRQTQSYQLSCHGKRLKLLF